MFGPDPFLHQIQTGVLVLPMSRPVVRPAQVLTLVANPLLRTAIVPSPVLRIDHSNRAATGTPDSETTHLPVTQNILAGKEREKVVQRTDNPKMRKCRMWVDWSPPVRLRRVKRTG